MNTTVKLIRRKYAITSSVIFVVIHRCVVGDCDCHQRDCSGLLRYLHTLLLSRDKHRRNHVTTDSRTSEEVTVHDGHDLVCRITSLGCDFHLCHCFLITLRQSVTLTVRPCIHITCYNQHHVRNNWVTTPKVLFLLFSLDRIVSVF